jgi:hypothetical protein
MQKQLETTECLEERWANLTNRLRYDNRLVQFCPQRYIETVSVYPMSAGHVLYHIHRNLLAYSIKPVIFPPNFWPPCYRP